MSLKLFFPLLLILLISPCSAVPVVFNDLNMVGRDISIYQSNATSTTLIYQGTTENSTIDLDPLNSYQIVFEPAKASWLDDPIILLTFFTTNGAGQILSFIVGLLFFGGLIKLAFR